MKVDMKVAMQAPQNEEVETQQEVHPKSIKAALEVNRMTQNLEVEVQPDESQTTISGQPTEETIVNASSWLEWLMGEQLKVFGTSNQPP
jgi:hypothetical protein